MHEQGPGLKYVTPSCRQHRLSSEIGIPLPSSTSGTPKTSYSSAKSLILELLGPLSPSQAARQPLLQCSRHPVHALVQQDYRHAAVAYPSTHLPPCSPCPLTMTPPSNTKTKTVTTTPAKTDPSTAPVIQTWLAAV